MKPCRQYILTAIMLWMWIPFALYSQADGTNEDVLQIPELDILIDSALEHSVLLRLNKVEYEKAKQELKLSRKTWSDYIYMEASGKYGRFDLTTITQSTTDTDLSGMVLQNEQFTYFAGVSVKYPLSGLVKQKNEKKIVKLDIEKNYLEAEQIRQDIIQLITDEYYQLKYFKQRISSSLEVLQTLEINFLKATRDIESGRIKLEEYSRIVESKGKAKNEYDKAVTDFYSRYYKLQYIVGFTF